MAQKISPARVRAFKKKIYDFYRVHGRTLPWRSQVTPYLVLVSEVMLQQTQVDRVVPFFRAWIKKFPSFEKLAKTSTTEVLRAWQGLGYNRRALALRRVAHCVMQEHGGRLPSDETVLRQLPGIGPYTAAAIIVFAFNMPVLCIETNIRRVYIHHFFPHCHAVSDAALLPIVAATLDHAQPRQWYSALMDYGSWLATQVANPNQRSRHYVKQTKFEGSNRQLRGHIMRFLLNGRRTSLSELARSCTTSKERITNVVGALMREGFLKMEKRSIVLV
jgi:A/G-specific adenine glycosylase